MKRLIINSLQHQHFFFQPSIIKKAEKAEKAEKANFCNLLN
jgi:hypothetical protein